MKKVRLQNISMKFFLKGREFSTLSRGKHLYYYFFYKIANPFVYYLQNQYFLLYLDILIQGTMLSLVELLLITSSDSYVWGFYSFICSHVTKVTIPCRLCPPISVLRVSFQH